MSQPPTPTTRVFSVSRTAGAAFRNMATQDWLMLGFHLFMWLRVTAAPDSADASFGRRFTGLLLTVTLTTIVLVRGELVAAGKARALLYRVGLLAPMIASYLSLRWVLAGLAPVLVDDQLMAIDRALLGGTPAVWMSAWNEPAFVEWFGFFYYSYFYLTAFMLLPMMFVRRGEGLPLQELTLGTLVICVIGHVGYTFVPGVGPHAHLAWDAPVDGGFFWSLIVSTIDSAGALLDIFPSLHTAYPVFFAAYAFRNRRVWVFRYCWPVVGFFAANMVVATMFLRWHWAIDVVAGLATAFVAFQVAVTLARKEGGRGEADDDRQPVWEPLWRRTERASADPV